MKICRFDENRIGLIQGDRVIDVTSALNTLAPMRWPFPLGDQFVSELAKLRTAIDAAAATAQSLPLSSVKLLSPVANPSKIIGIGRIYRDHAEEALRDPGIAHGRTIETPPDTIRMFIKANSALVGAGEGVALRFLDRRNDHECELAVVIGRRGTGIPRERVFEYVAGYSIGLDMTLRGPELASSRKSIDSYAVLGPCLVTAEDVTDPDALGFSLSVNGKIRQKANTRELAFGIAEILENAFRFYTLHPGDIIMTGTPAGVGPVVPGDVMDIECDKIGHMRVRVRAHETAAQC